VKRIMVLLTMIAMAVTVFAPAATAQSVPPQTSQCRALTSRTTWTLRLTTRTYRPVEERRRPAPPLRLVLPRPLVPRRPLALKLTRVLKLPLAPQPVRCLSPGVLRLLRWSPLRLSWRWWEVASQLGGFSRASSAEDLGEPYRLGWGFREETPALIYVSNLRERSFLSDSLNNPGFAAFLVC
jgi:hypothetical protein